MYNTLLSLGLNSLGLKYDTFIISWLNLPTLAIFLRQASFTQSKDHIMYVIMSISCTLANKCNVSVFFGRKLLCQYRIYSNTSSLAPLLFPYILFTLKILLDLGLHDYYGYGITRKLSYCKDDRAMCPILSCPEEFR